MAPVLPWLIPAIASVGAGVAGWFGQKSANDRNEKLAREQMAFQERMSSTSAQRSVADYSAAGLNPALAYDRPASSPSGAMSRVEDAVGKGISSAMQAKALQQSMKIAAAQSAADLQLKQSQTVRNAVEGATAAEQGTLLRSQYITNDLQRSFAVASQPFSLRLAAARALIEEYGVAGARNQSTFQKGMGAWAPGLQFFLNSAGSAARIGSGLGITR